LVRFIGLLHFLVVVVERPVIEGSSGEQGWSEFRPGESKEPRVGDVSASAVSRLRSPGEGNKKPCDRFRPTARVLLTAIGRRLIYERGRNVPRTTPRALAGLAMRTS
jgi:hypothetical protein